MKKRFLVAAVAATLVSPLAAQADATVYGNVHLSIDSPSFDDPTVNDNLDMNSNTSAIGVKGKEDLGGGMTALFKIEFQVDPSERASNGALTDRDQWVGLKGAMGTVKFGTMSNNYKISGAKIDPMYRTQLEGRGFMGTQSGLHGGAGENGGRSTNTLQYVSPKMGGMSVVFNYTISGADDETMGLGVHYKTKQIIAYVDYLDVQGSATGNGSGIAIGDSEAAFKVGGSYKMDAMTFGLQYESVEDVVGSDIVFASFNYQVNDNDNVAVTLGDVDLADDMGYAVMYNHKMSKRTNVYAGYGDDASNDNASQEQLTFGIRHKF
ncbi:MAG: porin [Gammaproteobacteria bacterium]|nr:porin [Gammaproteobacteria bacterium]